MACYNGGVYVCVLYACQWLQRYLWMSYASYHHIIKHWCTWYWKAHVTLSSTGIRGKSCFFCTWYSQPQWEVDHSHAFTHSHMLFHTPPLVGPEEGTYPTTSGPQFMDHCFNILSLIFFCGKDYIKVHRKAAFPSGACEWLLPSPQTTAMKGSSCVCLLCFGKILGI